MRLSPAAEKAVRGGHPWVFAESIRDQNRQGETGELAVIYSRSDRFLAAGLYDPASPLRVRILQSGQPAVINAEWWNRRLHETLARREGMFSPDTSGCRLINGESDGWPGLVLDRYAGTLVLKLYSAVWLPRLAEIADLIHSSLNPDGIVLRLSRNIQQSAKQTYHLEEGVIRGRSDDTVVFLENGLKFESEVRFGQKTGFFLDQRENRQRVRELASGADVLNAFSFSGGFSLYAADGGARRVTDLDISRHALASGTRNFELNAGRPAVAACRRVTVCADAFRWIDDGPEAAFDVVVVDPPSLAKRESERQGAIAAYQKLAAASLRLVRPGGVLVAASCSAHVTADEFFTAVSRGAAGFRTATLWTSGHAPDHAVNFPEGHYLKCTALRLTGGAMVRRGSR